MNRMITQSPDEVPQGRGPQSTAGGESFNQFRERVISNIHALAQKFAENPDQRLA